MSRVSPKHAIYKYYSSVLEKEVNWLWYPYIPYGKITLLQGDPGEGKSTFMLNVAAIVTKGGIMPDGFKTKEPQNVIYQCTEDDISDTVKPRLIAAGADCSKIAYIVDDEMAITLDDSRIEETIRSTGARLLILDPIQSFLVQNGDMLLVGRMRSKLAKLSRIATLYNCAVVLIGHMNKGNGNKDLYRGLGSIDIAAIARSVLMIKSDETDPNLRYMIPIKSSLSYQGSAISFRFTKKHGFQWERICRHNNENSSKSTKSTGLLKINSASLAITSILTDGDVLGSDIVSALVSSGISERTIYSAKKELNIVSIRRKGAWYWRLPSKGISDDNA